MHQHLLHSIPFHYIDLKQGISFRESIDDTTGISSKIVIDWSQNQKSKNFKPARCKKCNNKKFADNIKLSLIE